MDKQLFQRLRIWRGMQAQKEGVELYRVLPNSTLEEIARVVPRNKHDFLAIKGIKESRFKKYGAQLLAMTGDAPAVIPAVAPAPSPVTTSVTVSVPESAISSALQEEISEDVLFESVSRKGTLYTVSSFLDTLNMVFEEMIVRIQGEVSSVDERDKTIYFTLKDPLDGSIVQCLIFRYQYMISGVTLAVGQEIIIEGTPGIWKPAGRLSVKASSLEVSGVGALQKAYDDLKEKLEKEGMFAAEKKKPLPMLPQRIGLITSQQGAAIGDFLMNLGKHGFTISLLSSSVEGKKAVYELIDAVRYFQNNAHLYDVVVIIRGGGSLESLQAFNNETLLREVAKIPIPVLAGIGHEKDVSLVAMIADTMVSTPTAAARCLRQGYEDAKRDVDRMGSSLFEQFRIVLYDQSSLLQEYSQKIPRFLQDILIRYDAVMGRFHRCVEKYEYALTVSNGILDEKKMSILQSYEFMLKNYATQLMHYGDVLKLHNPQRMLELGYAYIKKGKKIVRSVSQVQKNDMVTVYVSDGAIDTIIQ